MARVSLRPDRNRGDPRRRREVPLELTRGSAVIESTTQVLLSGYAVGVVAGLIAWLVRRGVNS